MPILNYTTSIQASKTIMEIQNSLAKRGAKEIMISYEEGLPVAISFRIDWQGRSIAYRLPCHFTGVLNAMKKDKLPKIFQNKEQALKVGWRIIKDWIAAQIALVEAELAEMPEVFLPYAIANGGKTFYNFLQNNSSARGLIGSGD